MLTKLKKNFFILVFSGYIIGVLLGYSLLYKQYSIKRYCAESVGPISCQPDEDCDRECLKYYTKTESREKEAFYTYGLLGAFIAGWISVLVQTYILKE